MANMVPIFTFLALAFGVLSLPILPRSVAPEETWPSPGSCSDAYCGDTRALLNVSASDIVNGVVTTQIFWRRRDPSPSLKSVFVATLSEPPHFMEVTFSTIEGICGTITFSASAGPGQYAVYYMPYSQGNGGASTTFSWVGCNNTSPDESNPCVLGGGREDSSSSSSSSSVCTEALPSSSIVVGIEGRTAFDAFTDMEAVAAPAEVAGAIAALSQMQGGAPFMAVIPETRDVPVRMFHEGIPVRWTPAGGVVTYSSPPTFSGVVRIGEFYIFQFGLWAYQSGMAVEGIGGTSNEGFACSPSCPAIASDGIVFINLEGIDISGKNYTNGAFQVASGNASSIYVGVQIPPTAVQGSSYTGLLTLTSSSFPGSSVSVTVTLTIQEAGLLPFGGAGNITTLSRLFWLYSTRGLEDVVPSPFAPVTLLNQTASSLTLGCFFKNITLDASGLISSASVQSEVNESLIYSIFEDGEGMSFSLFSASDPTTAFQASSLSPPTITEQSASSISWSATSLLSDAATGGGNVTMNITGNFDFTGYVAFTITLQAATAGSTVDVSDAQLSYTMASANLGYSVGMETAGASYADVKWRWSNTTGSNKLWLGRPEAGLLLNLKGAGEYWNSPMFGADYPVIPFVPATWGGVSAAPSGNAFGVNCTGGRVLSFSGPRTIGDTVNNATDVFLVDVMISPSKRVDWARHWHTRQIQVGYGTPYLSPLTVAGMGASVVTLHQGVPGIVNGSLVNPYISYPFGDDVVPLLFNYTQQSNALGMATKFYYTIRELSSHAAETFAFLSFQGEIFLDQDPYIVVQPGYSHAWNAHGGSAYLHQHLISDYAACWQQTLSNGEWDPAVCDMGVSRLFNFYVEGLYWSFTQAPFINGIYYDGTNFPKLSMMRIRRAADAAAKDANSPFPALLDLHSGRDPTPPACSYMTHYPFMGSIWNGEGFDFSQGPSYWLIEIASRHAGLTGDMLGSPHSALWKGMLFGMTERNAATSTAIWSFWDAIKINETTSIGWWETVGDIASTPLLPIIPSSVCPSPPDPEHSQVLATVYLAPGSHALLVLASYCPSSVNVSLAIDWEALGMPAGTANVTIPSIPGVQAGSPVTDPSGPFTIAGDEGLFILFSV